MYLKQQISMISEGSWDIEEIENSALHHKNKLYLKIHYNRK